MQVVKQGRYAYVAHTGHSGGALTILDCADPRSPQIVYQIDHAPNTRSHKVQVADGLLLQNCELPYFGDPSRRDKSVRGVNVYALDDPREPRLIGFHRSGGRGAHRLWYDGGRYAHIAASRGGEESRAYQIVDLERPERPELVGEWSMPGTNTESDRPRWPTCVPEPWYEVHGVIPHDNLAYVACEDAGMAILDITQPTNPQLVGVLHWPSPGGGMTHTCLPLPGRTLAVVAEEQLAAEHERGRRPKRVWLVDITAPRVPRIVSALPIPTAAPDVELGPYDRRPDRFGPHNVHENRTGSFQSETVVFATYFGAGVRAYDISDAEVPREVAHLVPPAPDGEPSPQLNDLHVDTDGTVYATDRHGGGLYVMSTPFLS